MRFLFIIIFTITVSFSLDIQKPKVYKKNMDIKGWYMSEKLDGIRAFWNGKELLSKNGNKIYAPSWFIKSLPKFSLDGELWTKRNDFETIQSIVLDKTPSKNWKKISYNIFEVPNAKGNFAKRLNKLKLWLKEHPTSHLNVISQIVCQNKKHLETYLNELVNKKAEGIILKNPNLSYFTGRNSNILKVKKFFDDEAVVIGINRHSNGDFKSLKVKLKNGVIFNLGTGFTNQQRKNHPKVGDIVTFKFYGLTKYKKPKFASFLRVRKED
ncbi:MAG: DNA ligase [Campylobacterota bacterium]